MEAWWPELQTSCDNTDSHIAQYMKLLLLWEVQLATLRNTAFTITHALFLLFLPSLVSQSD